MHLGQVLWRHLLVERILATVEGRLDLQALCRGGAGDEFDDDVVADQRSASPVLGDMAEETMLNLVPFAGARRQMADRQPQAGTVGQLLQRDLPQAATSPVAAASVLDHHRLMAAAANSAVSWSIPTLTQASLRVRS